MTKRNWNAEEIEAMNRICENYHDVFMLDGDPLPFTTLVKHKIHTKSEQPAINQRQYRLPQVHKEEINRQVSELLKEGIISPSISPWNSPILLVPKKSQDGQKAFRLVVDFRKLNEATIKQVFPIPRIDEILDQLGNSRYFTTLDLASGYHQVLVDEQDKEKTAFSTDKGHYEFNRMPFGLTGAPATFQMAMNTILTGLQGLDCFVSRRHSRIREKYSGPREKIYNVLSRHGKNGRTNNEAVEKKYKIFVDPRLPTSIRTSKRRHYKPSILIYPDFTQPFRVTTDASNAALGAVLSQIRNGNDHPIAFASRTLSDTEKRYSTIEKKCSA
ncbi:Retrovirus-related Pol polyprotein from transposon 17.6 [Eumeta japonica]|uniref:Retrovirus-related Pol polyprotein from transposon 17.6 n=1 Tax=Eumeta variegata TaxID=151549 RepID=A0A4C1TT44_EUMVA|nr:Retrovirus-related Pol polyprotein from transposon 17.6 [Eumeta japonica]